MEKIIAFLGAWIVISFVIWIALWTLIATILSLVKDPFTNMDDIFPFPLGGLTVLGAVFLGMLFAGILAATKIKDMKE